jgi:dCMP deaminase
MRPSFDEVFMRSALLFSERATCSRLKVGAVIVQEGHMIAQGYNGGVRGETHCIEEGCLMRDGHCIRTTHAEQNALLMCAKLGVSTKGATIYCTHLPCLHCTKSIITAGITEVLFLHNYRPDEYALKLLKHAKIKLGRVHIDGN